MEEREQQMRKEELRRSRKELKRATEKANKEYLTSILNEITEFQRTVSYGLMYMKKGVGLRGNQGI